MSGRHQRYAVKVAGASGQGISSTGKIMARALKSLGYHVFEYREYPSLIRGGFATSQIDIGDHQIKSSRQKCDFLVCLDRRALHEYLLSVEKDGTIIHALTRVIFNDEEKAYLQHQNIDVHFVDVFKHAKEIGQSKIFANQIMLGLAWKKMSLPIDALQEQVKNKFGKKEELLKFNLNSLDFGYNLDMPGLRSSELDFKTDKGWKNSLLIKGNEALAIGGIHAGVRAFFGYPMTPSTSIMGTFSKFYHQTGVVVKQAEDEITAAQMAIGAMFAGTRALTATSGGGFDLMTESISLAGMTETPFVCVIAQRPGPATGLPTWTGASDLNIAVYAGHGEFARCVIAASDAESSFRLIQNAMNIAEQYQLVVILLTEKQISECLFNEADLESDIKIERGLVNDLEDSNLLASHRFEINESGVSRRWIPGQHKATYLANSDEHLADGTLTEHAEPSAKMYAKRMRKQSSLLDNLPEPELFGNPNAKNIIIGWGSTKNTVLNCFEIMDYEEVKDVAYLHFEYLFPLRTEKLRKLQNEHVLFHLIEANYTGQLGQLIKQHVPIKFEHKFLKYDGRPFFVEETVNFILDITRKVEE